MYISYVYYLYDKMLVYNYFLIISFWYKTTSIGLTVRIKLFSSNGQPDKLVNHYAILRCQMHLLILVSHKYVDQTNFSIVTVNQTSSLTITLC